MEDETEDFQESLLSFKEKTSFFVVNMGNIPIMTLLNMYLLYYYLDVLGLDPIAIGTLFLISRVLDGFNDPLMGFVVDHLPKTKLGRFRSYIIIGSIICAINYLFIWLGPSLATNGKIIIAYISYILFGFTFDLMDIPLNSMIPTMSDRDKDRNLLSSIKGLGYGAGSVIFTLGTIPFVNFFPSEKLGYTIWIIIASIFVVSLSIIGTLGIKERIQPTMETKYSGRELFKILGAKPVFVLFAETLMNSIAGGITNSVVLFFFVYVLKAEELYVMIGISSIIGSLIGIALTPFIVKKIGKKQSKIIASIIAVLGPIISFFIPRSMPIFFIIIPVLTFPGLGIRSMLDYGIQADNMDFIEWEFGFRAEGAVASMNSFIIKTALGIGSSITAYLLVFFEYVPDIVQSDYTIFGLYVIYFAIPAALMVIGLLVWTFGYPLTRSKRLEMMKDLSERRFASNM